MSLATDRRGITLFLLILLAVLAVRATDAKQLALTLTPIAALLIRVIAFYFPMGRGRGRVGGREGESASRMER